MLSATHHLPDATPHALILEEVDLFGEIPLSGNSMGQICGPGGSPAQNIGHRKSVGIEQFCIGGTRHVVQRDVVGDRHRHIAFQSPVQPHRVPNAAKTRSTSPAMLVMIWVRFSISMACRRLGASTVCHIVSLVIQTWNAPWEAIVVASWMLLSNSSDSSTSLVVMPLPSLSPHPTGGRVSRTPAARAARTSRGGRKLIPGWVLFPPPP